MTVPKGSPDDLFRALHTLELLSAERLVAGRPASSRRGRPPDRTTIARGRFVPLLTRRGRCRSCCSRDGAGDRARDPVRSGRLRRRLRDDVAGGGDAVRAVIDAVQRRHHIRTAVNPDRRGCCGDHAGEQSRRTGCRLFVNARTDVFLAAWRSGGPVDRSGAARSTAGRPVRTAVVP